MQNKFVLIILEDVNSDLQQQALGDKSLHTAVNICQTIIQQQLCKNKRSMEWLHQHLLDGCSVAPQKNAGMDKFKLCQKLKGNLKELLCTTRQRPAFAHIFFLSLFSIKTNQFLQVSFKVLVQPSRHRAGAQKETRLQNGEKLAGTGPVPLRSGRAGVGVASPLAGMSTQITPKALVASKQKCQQLPRPFSGRVFYSLSQGYIYLYPLGQFSQTHFAL